MPKPVIDDKKLSQLRKAVDPEAMAPAFEEFFSRTYSDRALTVQQCQVTRVYHKPGRECNLTYRLLGQDGAGRKFDQWFSAKIFAGGDDRSASRTEQPVEWPGCDFWKPVSFWPEMNMVLHAFPYDPKLPYLSQLVQPDYVKQQVEKNLAGLGLTNDWQCREVVIHKIKYMPNKRCVLRLDLSMAGAGDQHRQIVLYSKTYKNAQSRYVFDVLQQVCRSPACTSGVLNIPGPVAHLDGANTLWQHAWEGESFSRVADRVGWENFPDSGFVPAIATTLAALHQLELTGLKLQPGHSILQILENACDDAVNILPFLPDRREDLRRITKNLKALATQLMEEEPRTTIHGTFKLAQLLVRDDQVALVDFDSIALGDPHQDMAEMIASLEFKRLADRIPAPAIKASIESFLADYQEHVPWGCDRRRIAWYVVAFLLGKIHSSLKRLEAEGMTNVSLAFDVVQEWLEVMGS